jgi:hypothetical protein
MTQDLITASAKLWSTIGRVAGVVALLCGVSFVLAARAQGSCSPSFGMPGGSPMTLPGPSQAGAVALPISIVAGKFFGHCTGATCDTAVAEQAGLTPDALLIARGNADGTFDQPGAPLAIGTSPVAIATGTFQQPAGDGRDDIAVGFQDASSGLGRMMILLAQPGGSYAAKEFAPGQNSLPAGISPSSMAAGRFASGRSFVAVGNHRAADGASPAPTISVFVEDSSFNFTIEELPVPSDPDHPLSQSIFLAAADIFGQGVPGGIAVGYKDSNQLLILHRNENAPSHFDDPRKVPMQAGLITRAIAALKRPSTDSDAFVVLASDAQGNTNIVMVENQNGALTTTTFPVPILGATAIAAVAVDQATYMLAVAHGGQDNGIRILRLTRNANGDLTMQLGEDLGVGDTPLSVTFARDGASVVASLANNELAFFGLDGGTFHNTVPTPTLVHVRDRFGNLSPPCPTAGVFHHPHPDDAGPQDLAYVSIPEDNNRAFLSVLQSGGGGEFLKEGRPAVPLAQGPNPRALAVGQIRSNHPDNMDDVAILDADLTLRIFLSSDDSSPFGVFVEAIGSPIPLTDSVSSGFTPRSIAVGHFRAGIDKPLDILVVGQGEMRILFGDGTGQFAPSPNSPPITLPLRADPSSVIVGNFNFHNDGRDDIAFKVDPVNGPPSVQILFNNGIGQFPTGTSLSIRLVCHPLADQRIACQTLGMSPLINNSFGKAPGPVILSFLNLTSIVGGIDEVDPRLQAAYGVVKDSSSQQLNLQQCVPEACPRQRSSRASSLRYEKGRLAH